MREVGASKGKKTPSTSAPPAGRVQLRRDRAGARAEGARACRKSLAPALAPAQKSLRGGAHRVADRGRAAEEGERVRARPRPEVGACARVPSPRFSRAHGSSTQPHTPHNRPQPPPPSHATPRAPAPPPSLLPSLSALWRVTQPARVCALGARVGARARGAGGRARAPIHLRAGARRAGARGGRVWSFTCRSRARARRGAVPRWPCQSPRRLAAPGRSRPPRSLLPNCYPECYRQEQ